MNEGQSTKDILHVMPSCVEENIWLHSIVYIDQLLDPSSDFELGTAFPINL